MNASKWSTSGRHHRTMATCHQPGSCWVGSSLPAWENIFHLLKVQCGLQLWFTEMILFSVHVFCSNCHTSVIFGLTLILRQEVYCTKFCNIQNHYEVTQVLLNQKREHSGISECHLLTPHLYWSLMIMQKQFEKVLNASRVHQCWTSQQCFVFRGHTNQSNKT